MKIELEQHTDYTLTLTGGEVALVASLLNKQPYGEVCDLMTKIITQLNSQKNDTARNNSQGV